MEQFTRSKNILRNKLIKYLFPTMLTMAALSLNEFVDSMIVSNLLGTEAMAIVNLGMPLMLLLAFIYLLFGNGGATIYALALGRRDSKTAGEVFRISILISSLLGLIIAVVGLTFNDQIAAMLCKADGIRDDFTGYLKVLFFSSPFLTLILSYVEFLAPAGLPFYSTLINVIANGVNILMDFIYIKVFHMGVSGAAFATLTGYSVGLIPIIYLFASHKFSVPKTKLPSVSMAVQVVIVGIPYAFIQIGYAIKIAVGNTFSFDYGGDKGLIAFSLCFQSLSIVSIFLAAFIGASAPLMAVLHGQKDYQGEHIVLKTSIRMMTVVMIICTALLEIFPTVLTKMYGVVLPDQVEICIRALRIFAITFIPRSICMLFSKYLQSVEGNKYSLFISLFDGVLGIVPITIIGCYLVGADGVWAGYSITAILLFAIIIVCNIIIARRSEGRVTGLLLKQNDDEALRILDISIGEEDAGNLGEAVQKFYEEGGVEKNRAVRAALAAEEMVVYTKEHSEKYAYMDVLARLYEDKIEMDFRSLGDRMDPIKSTEDTENLRLIRNVSDSLSYDYIMGMNCTRAVVSIGVS